MTKMHIMLTDVVHHRLHYLCNHKSNASRSMMTEFIDNITCRNCRRIRRRLAKICKVK